MRILGSSRGLAGRWTCLAAALALLLSGCPAAEKKPVPGPKSGDKEAVKNAKQAEKAAPTKTSATKPPAPAPTDNKPVVPTGQKTPAKPQSPAEPPAPKSAAAATTPIKPASKTTADQSTAMEGTALSAAESWLALADREEYSQCWENAAEPLKTLFPRRDFIRTLNDTRKPLGKLKSRHLLSKEFTASLSDAPPGQYMVIKYQAVYDKKGAVTETITPMLGKDKQWRVSAYRVK